MSRPWEKFRETTGNDGLTRDERLFGDKDNPDEPGVRNHGHVVTVRHSTGPDSGFSTIEYIRHEGGVDPVVAHGKSVK